MPVFKIAHKVNHVALVIDRSGSMRPHEGSLLRVADSFVESLKKTSDALGHETRLSIYAFDHEVSCLVWDMDVHNVPSLKGRYTVDNGATALLEATVNSLDDLNNEVSQKYGDHMFLQMTITDGEENASGCSQVGFAHHNRLMHRHLVDEWKRKLTLALDQAGLRRNKDGKPNWTCGIMVPTIAAKQVAVEYGFQSGNVEIWNANSTTGIEEAIGSIQVATDNLLRSHDRGVSSTKNLFAVGQELSASEVKANLKALDAGKYLLITVDRQSQIREFVTRAGHPYKTGCAFYELSKREKIQVNKQIAVAEKDPHTGRMTGKVFSGPAARQLLGLPDTEVSVKPGHNSSYTIFVQSTSVNRKLVAHTKLLLMM